MTGNATILLHTLGADSRTWDDFRACGTAGQQPTLALDLPGHGSRTAETFTLDACLAAVDQATADAGPMVDVIGSGLGGVVALHWAYTRRQARSLAVVGLGAATSEVVSKRVAAVRETLERHGVQRFAEDYVAGTVTHAGPSLRQRLTQLLCQMRPDNILAALTSAATVLPASATRVPTLVIRPEADPRSPVSATAELARTLGAEHTTVAGCGHYAYAEDPRRLWACAVGWAQSTAP